MKSKVYFIRSIDSDSLCAIYDALGTELHGKVAIKISTGEPAVRRDGRGAVRLLRPLAGHEAGGHRHHSAAGQPHKPPQPRNARHVRGYAAGHNADALKFMVSHSPRLNGQARHFVSANIIYLYSESFLYVFLTFGVPVRNYDTIQLVYNDFFSANRYHMSMRRITIGGNHDGRYDYDRDY